MQHYTYLLINFLTVICCFIFSFHPAIGFNRYFLPFIKASSIVAIPFIVWDAWFTQTGVWWFNGRYVTGLYLLGLPVEEWLFFICIPFSCLFTNFVLQRHLPIVKNGERYQRYFVAVFLFICLLICCRYPHKIYPFVTFLVAGLSLFYFQFIARASWLGKTSCVYAVLLVPFLIVNGFLTGTGLDEPVVNYNAAMIFNIRILTVPVEDMVYGYILVLWNVFAFRQMIHVIPGAAATGEKMPGL